ncbi:Structural maintenance of chromosomes protein 6 [Mycoemilia scoparia]|uniref:Structural maintenance of chromosomes protein 6 n=1 Tax=Mycoemilia scoparia TaxID=417184 RepID=A0A9W8A0K1_9FUNG|nr:Structural maintenance of chromosomes protein 6 [Mycoemilia scoparia]
MSRNSRKHLAQEFEESSNKRQKGLHSQALAQEGDAVTSRIKNVTTVQGRPSKNRSGNEPDIGVIESVEIHDFMCHKSLEVSLCPRLNFITGQNGSGKSAILTALTIALGGKASSTNRSTNLRGFIREGASKAEVKVRLRNRGPDAYYPDIYGDSILIVRQLSRDGIPSQYKIKNGNTGKTVSTKKNDVMAITDHMAIQIDNPINILSQDAAREFLASTSPDSMYIFFLKGTQLMQLSQDLGVIRDAVSKIEASLKRKREILPEMKRQKVDWQTRLEGVKQAKELFSKLNALEKEIAWAYVVEVEHEIEDARQAVHTQELKLNKIAEKLREAESKAAESQNVVNRTRTSLEQKNEQLAPIERDMAVPREEMANIRNSLTNLKAIEEDMNRDARYHRTVLDDLEKKIAEAKKRLEMDQENETKRIQKEMDEIGEVITEFQNSVRSYEESQSQLENRRLTLQSARNNAEQRRYQVVKEISSCKEDINRLKKQQTNMLAAFGEGVPEVVAEIERQNWKGPKPLGPLGRYVKLRDSSWAAILETLLDRGLNAFMVQSHDDRRKLDSIMQQYRCRSNIIVGKVEMFDYSNGEPDQDFVTMLRILNFESEIVKRQLINMSRIEQIILVERRSMGDKIILQNNRRYPHNVASIVTKDGYTVGSRTGGLQSQVIFNPRSQGRLVADTRIMMQQANSKLAELQETLVTINREMEDLESQIQETKIEDQDLQRKIRKAKERIGRSQSELMRKREELQELVPPNLSALENERNEAKQKLVAVQKQFVENRARKSELIEKLRSEEEKLEKLSLAEQRIQDDIDALREQLDSEQGELNKNREHISYWNSKQDQRQEALTQAQKVVEELEAKLVETTRGATQVSQERMEPRANIQKLDTEINHTRACINEIEQSQSMSFEQIAQKAKMYIEAYDKAKAEMRGMAQLAKELKNALERRLSRWTQFRDSMTVRTKLQFTSHLYTRGYTGTINFDHIDRKLSLKVHTNQDISLAHSSSSKDSNGTQKTLHQRKDTKSLSGGEKSFTTICLLLSLWEAMSCPIRALDEFDVFMDMANRRIATHMIVESAKANASTQFLLISPQSTSINPDPDVKILKLTPPDRQR